MKDAWLTDRSTCYLAMNGTKTWAGYPPSYLALQPYAWVDLYTLVWTPVALRAWDPHN